MENITGYEQAKAAIAAGAAVGRSLWVIVADENQRANRAIKPDPWEGPGEYQCVTFADRGDVLIYLGGRTQGLPTESWDVKPKAPPPRKSGPLTTCPKPGGLYEVREGEGPFADRAPLLAIFTSATAKDDAATFVAARLVGGLWLAEIGTRHYEFRAVGANEHDAREALRAGLKAHADVAGCFGNDPRNGESDAECWVRETLADANVSLLWFGAAYRDDHQLTGPR